MYGLIYERRGCQSQSVCRNQKSRHRSMSIASLSAGTLPCGSTALTLMTRVR